MLVEQSSGTNINTQVWQGDGISGNTLLNPTGVNNIYTNGRKLKLSLLLFKSMNIA
ncbi:hypothetical protein [Floridanema evergladense]|uniref:Uncharacterized protein n=1 Tax=Floridaenema evergladense BLCC-F167 TaxID=3153639 RepID=A0ABV4WFN7_9CYAN